MSPAPSSRSTTHPTLRNAHIYSHPVQAIGGIGDLFIARADDAVSGELLQSDLATLTEPWRLLSIVPKSRNPAIASTNDVCKRPVLVLERREEDTLALRIIKFKGYEETHTLTATVVPPSGKTRTFDLNAPGEEHLVKAGSKITLHDSASGDFSFVAPHFLITRGLMFSDQHLQQDGAMYRCLAEPCDKVERLLKYLHLQPVRTVKVRGGEIKLSDIFSMDESRTAVVAWVQAGKDKGGTLQILYQSNSQGIFRVLPAMNLEIVTETMDVAGYNKGPGEGAITVGARVQAALAKMLAERGPRADIPSELGNLVAQHIVPVNRFIQEEPLWYKSLNNPERFIKKQKLLRAVDKDVMLKTEKSSSVPPERVVISNPAKRPDFVHGFRMKFEISSVLSGKVRAFVYRSFDRSVEYTLLVDKDQIAWFGQVESIRSPFSVIGVRETALDAEDLISPRWEYPQNLPKQFHGAEHPTNVNYVDGQAYLAKIPELRRWHRLRAQGKIRAD